MAADLAAVADLRPFLDFHERADLHIVANLAPVKIYEAIGPNPLAELYVRRNLSTFVVLHSGQVLKNLFDLSVCHRIAS